MGNPYTHDMYYNNGTICVSLRIGIILAPLSADVLGSMDLGNQLSISDV